MFASANKMLGGILLVAGTQIGAGMLALPLTTGIAGLPGAVLVFLICFLYMLASLFLLLEANTYDNDQSTNIIGMAKRHLGKQAEYVAWTSFMLLMYAALSAYISGASEILSSATNFIPILKIDNVRICAIAFVFGAITFLGTNWIDNINRILMFGLVFSYITMVTTLIPHIQISNLTHNYIQYIPAAIPVVILSFTSHIILPSLREYLDNNIEQLKWVLLIGSLIPLLIYLIWVLIIVGIIPHQGAFGILNIAHSQHPIANLSQAITHEVGNNILGQNNSFFAFCALTTSMLGVLLSLRDFLANGLRLDTQVNKNALLLIVLCLLPPTLLLYCSPGLFVTALSYGGVLIAILYGILPSLMVYKARYHEKNSSLYRFPGGKFSLCVVILGAILVIITQILLTQGLLTAP